MQAFADVDRQQSAVAFATQAQQRYHHLYSIQAASLEESQRSDQDLRQAQKMLVDAADQRAHGARASLRTPAGRSRVAHPDQPLRQRADPDRSPIDGVVMTRNVTVGQVVATGFEAFVVSNLAHRLGHRVGQREGSPAGPRRRAGRRSSARAIPTQIFHGRVGMIGDMLDPQTRTVPVRIVVPNPDTLLRPGMFATAQHQRVRRPATRSSSPRTRCRTSTACGSSSPPPMEPPSRRRR